MKKYGSRHSGLGEPRYPCYCCGLATRIMFDGRRQCALCTNALMSAVKYNCLAVFKEERM